jgi:hypothetical protein
MSDKKPGMMPGFVFVYFFKYSGLTITVRHIYLPRMLLDWEGMRAIWRFKGLDTKWAALWRRGRDRRMDAVWRRRGLLSAEQMRCGESKKLARRDDLGLLPESWEVAFVPSDEVVGASCVGAFQEDVVVGVQRSVNTSNGGDHVAAISDELHELESNAPRYS